MDKAEALIRNDEREKIFSELTVGIYFDGDEDRRLKAAFRRREEREPVLWSKQPIGNPRKEQRK